MRDTHHYQRLLDANPSASVGLTLAASAIYAARHGLCEAEHYGTDELKNLIRALKSRYGDSLTVDEVRGEMQTRTAAATLGRKGGRVKSAKKSAAAKQNIATRWAKYRAEKVEK